MGTTECYAMVRGSAVRVTGLGPRGSVPDAVRYAVSKTVAKVTINEVTESGSNETLGSSDTDNDNRLRFTRSDEMLYYTVDMDFLRCDPGVLSLITGVPLVDKATGEGLFGDSAFGESSFGGESVGTGMGFGETGFGDEPFGVGVPNEPATIIGFDSMTRLPPVNFGLEVWSKLIGQACVDGKKYGYTVLPFLRGGRLTGFEFSGGLVSFNVRGAQTRRAPRWGVGPFDLEGTHERLLQRVSRNTLYRQMLTTAVPPTQVDGIQETEDVIDGNSGTDDIIDGNDGSPWIIDGGAA